MSIMKTKINKKLATAQVLRIVPKKQPVEELVLPVTQEQEPFPFTDYDEMMSTRWGKAVAHELLSQLINSRIDILRKFAKTLMGRADQLSKHGINGKEIKPDRLWLESNLKASIEIIAALEKVLSKGVPPTDKDWANIIAPYLDNQKIKKTITVIGKTLQLPPVTANAFDEAKYIRAKTKLLAAHKGSWAASALDNFLAFIEKRQKNYENKNYIGKNLRFSGKTKLTCLYVANRLLSHLIQEGLIDVIQIKQHHLDEFYCRNKIAASFAAYFVKYLNNSGYFTFKFIVPKIKRTVNIQNLILQDEIEAITDKLLAEKSYLQEALLAIFALYYGQSPHKCIKLPMSRLGKDSDGGMLMRFHAVDIPVHPTVALKMREWLATRESILLKHGIQDHPLIFFNTENPQVPLYLEHLPRKLKIKMNFKRAQATAIVNLYHNGVRSARSLMDTIGVSLNTAMAYMHACSTLYVCRADMDIELP